MTHPIAERLASPDPAVRRAACCEAARDPAATLLAGALTDALGDPDKAVVRAASDALIAIARGPGGVARPLQRALRGRDRKQRWGAAFTTARLEPPSPKLLPALVDAMGAEDGDVRWAAARLLVETGRLHDEVLPLLIGLVRDGESPALRRMASYALRELAPDRPEAARVLVAATRDADLGVRRAALTAMAALMGPPPEVGARLVEALERDADAASRRLAALALGALGAREPLPAGAGEALARAAGASDRDLARAAERARELAGAAR